MWRKLLAVNLILLSLAGCATVPKPNPRVEARLQEANTVLDDLSVDSAAFYAGIEILLQDIRTLYDQPGWAEMETLIAFRFSRTEVEDDPAGDEDLQSALEEWSAKWGDRGEDLWLLYRSLADRCSISEARRIGLIGRLSSLQASYLEAVLTELSANRYAPAQAIFGTVEALSRVETELNSYSLNAIGLYEVNPSR